MKVWYRFAALTSAFLVVSGCQNPASRSEQSARAFRQKHPERIVSYAGPNRQMRAVSNGDPQKRPLIFVHGSPGNWEGWGEYLLDPSLLHRFHVIAVDRPGYGGSTPGKTEPSLSKQAEDVLAALSLNKGGLAAILVGHSYGGPVIAKASVLAPQKVAALVFVASSVDPDLEETKWFQVPAQWWPIRVLIPSMLRVCNEEILALEEELRVLDREWPLIRQPIAIVHGDQDPLVPAANRLYLHKKLPASQIVFDQLLQGVNHFVPWNQKANILEAVFALESSTSQKEP